MTIVSNMLSVVVMSHRSEPHRIQGATSWAGREPGHNTIANRWIRNTEPKPKAGPTSRPQISVGPKTPQPALINQNSRGGLWL